MDGPVDRDLRRFDVDDIMTGTNPDMPSSTLELPIPRKRRPWRSLMLGLVILFCGILIGAGITVITLHKVVVYAIHHPEQVPNRITERLRNKLSLSDEQAKKVKAVLVERHKAFLALRRVTRPKVDRELERLREEVAAVLDENQARKWRKRFDTIRRQWMPPPPPAEKGG
jgi:hypothetical protein